jgi:hypothetical protein
MSADRGCRNVLLMPDRRDRRILIPPFQGGAPNALEERRARHSGWLPVG